MREINTRDTVAFARIIAVTNIKEDIAKASAKGAAVKAEAAKIADEDERAAFISRETEALGIDVCINLLMKAVANPKTEQQLYELIAGIAETDENGKKLKADDIGKMKITDTIALVKQIAEANNLVDFFRNASALTTK
ncbi:MAG: hypothetical protein IKO53_04980 [Lachnospiraceae bacterium]|nr:hypothetical protein [Lachnospiraceae bacterium]